MPFMGVKAPLFDDDFSLTMPCHWEEEDRSSLHVSEEKGDVNLLKISPFFGGESRV